MIATERIRRRKTELVQARVDPETKRRLQAMAETEVLDESDIVRRALALYLQPGRRLAS